MRDVRKNQNHERAPSRCGTDFCLSRAQARADSVAEFGDDAAAVRDRRPDQGSAHRVREPQPRVSLSPPVDEMGVCAKKKRFSDRFFSFSFSRRYLFHAFDSCRLSLCEHFTSAVLTTTICLCRLEDRGAGSRGERELSTFLGKVGMRVQSSLSRLSRGSSCAHTGFAAGDEGDGEADSHVFRKGGQSQGRHHDPRQVHEPTQGLRLRGDAGPRVGAHGAHAQRHRRGLPALSDPRQGALRRRCLSLSLSLSRREVRVF